MVTVHITDSRDTGVCDTCVKIYPFGMVVQSDFFLRFY